MFKRGMWRILLVLALALTGLGCRAATNLLAGSRDSQAGTGNLECQPVVDALVRLTQGLKLPANLAQQDARRSDQDFDVNQFFTVLTHLHMQEGFTLDYVYTYDGLGGYPTLYTRPVGQARYATTEEYTQALGKPQGGAAYLEHVQSDGSQQAFLELAALTTLGPRFYIFWHAGYGDVAIVCERTTLEEIVSSLAKTDFGKPMPLQDQVKARTLEPAPQVRMDQDRVTVDLLTFAIFGGFSRETLVFQRAAPHRLLDSKHEKLVPYDSGIVF